MNKHKSKTILSTIAILLASSTVVVGPYVLSYQSNSIQANQQVNTSTTSASDMAAFNDSNKAWQLPSEFGDSIHDWSGKFTADPSKYLTTNNSTINYFNAETITYPAPLFVGRFINTNNGSLQPTASRINASSAATILYSSKYNDYNVVKPTYSLLNHKINTVDLHGLVYNQDASEYYEVREVNNHGFVDSIKDNAMDPSLINTEELLQQYKLDTLNASFAKTPDQEVIIWSAAPNMGARATDDGYRFQARDADHKYTHSGTFLKDKIPEESNKARINWQPILFNGSYYVAELNINRVTKTLSLDILKCLPDKTLKYLKSIDLLTDEKFLNLTNREGITTPQWSYIKDISSQGDVNKQISMTFAINHNGEYRMYTVAFNIDDDTNTQKQLFYTSLGVASDKVTMDTPFDVNPIVGHMVDNTLWFYSKNTIANNGQLINSVVGKLNMDEFLNNIQDDPNWLSTSWKGHNTKDSMLSFYTCASQYTMVEI